MHGEAARANVEEDETFVKSFMEYADKEECVLQQAFKCSFVTRQISSGRKGQTGPTVQRKTKLYQDICLGKIN